MFRKPLQNQTSESITYVCVYSSLAPLGEEIIDKTIAGHPRGCFSSKNLQVNTDLIAAQENALECMRKEILHSINQKSIFGLPETLIADHSVLDNLRSTDKTILFKQLKELKINDFKANVFLTFELRGAITTIHELLNNKRYIQLAAHIARTIDSKGNELSAASMRKN